MQHERKFRAARAGSSPGTRHAARRADTGDHHRPAPARPAGAVRLGAHRPVAGAADPGRVRGGVRPAGRARTGRLGLRLGAHRAGQLRVRDRRAHRRRPGPRGLRGDHRRRPRHHGGGQQGRHPERRRLRGPGHRAAQGDGPERLRRRGPGVPLLLRQEDLLHQVLPGLRGAARRVRHDGRAVRGAHPGRHRQDHPVSDRPGRPGVLVRAAPGPARRNGNAGVTIPVEPPCGSDITGRAWHDSYVPVLFLIAIVAVLVGIFFTATGRGGELAYEQADHAPLDLGPVSAADIALLRPPTAMWGYNMQVTDAALDQISRAVRERDVTIAYLQEQVVSLARGSSYAEPKGAHARLDPGSPLAPEVPLAPEILPYPGATWASKETSTPEPAEPTQTHPIAEDTEPFEVPGDTEPFAAAAAPELPAPTELPATEVP